MGPGTAAGRTHRQTNRGREERVAAKHLRAAGRRERIMLSTAQALYVFKTRPGGLPAGREKRHPLQNQPDASERGYYSLPARDMQPRRNSTAKRFARSAGMLRDKPQ